MEDFKKFHSSTFDTNNCEERIVEDQDTTVEVTGKIRELQHEMNCMDDSRGFQDAESISSGHSHVIRYLEEFSAILWECQAAVKGRQAFGTHTVCRETFLQIQMRHHKNYFSGIHRSRSRSIHPQWRKVKGKNKIKI